MRKHVVTAYATDESLPKITAQDSARLTHLNIAFGLVREHSVQTAHLKNLPCLACIRAANPSIQILLSVGGWGAGGFSEAASTPEGRKTFARSCAAAAETLGLDGIDIDWEYPCYAEADIAASPNDKETFTLLLRETRSALNGCSGNRKLLTIAAGADQYFVEGTNMAEVQEELDYVQLMTYDMRGGFQTLTGHHTNLYTPDGDLFRISADRSVQLFMAASVPADKIVLGSAFYARMWKNVPDKNNGLHQMTASSGGYGASYSGLVENYIDKNGFTRYWDAQACAPYLFNGDIFVSYDDKQSVACKCHYIKEHKLAGLMYWEYSGDGSGILLQTIHRELNET